MLLNLISNAKDAMPLGGRLQIETKKARLSPDQARAYGGLDPGEYIQLFVSDTGVGMDQATQTRIFDPFFTTKPKDKGTGLGLSIVYGIVKQMKGAVSVYSEPGHGTQFKIHFPTSPEGLTRPTAQTESKETTPVLDLRRAIVVEDDKSVRTFLHNILQGLKLEVIEAATAAEAEAAIPPFFGERVLMICDVVLPDQNGRQLAETLKGRGYLLEIIFISGYTENVVFHDHALDPGVHFLNKPFAPADLIAKIRQICDKG
jgi:CheY-like chemotaxis protein